MKNLFLLVLLLCSLNGFSQRPKDKASLRLVVENASSASRENVLIQIPLDKLKALGSEASNFIVQIDSNEVPSQVNRADKFNSGLNFVIDQLAAKQKLSVEVRVANESASNGYPKRTQAEISHKVGGEWKGREYIGGSFKNVDYLRVPPEHKDHSWFIRYEGPGWESDKVGYRFYLDQRNAIDVFGKKTREPILQKVGHDNFDSYHEMNEWGMDILKVGKSLGLGSIGALSNGSAVRVEKTDSVACRILDNGPVFSSFVTDYYGWQVDNKKTNLSVTTSIHAGTRLTKQQLRFTGDALKVCTGIGKDTAAEAFSSKGSDSAFGYLATYGKQSLNDDEVGLVVFFPSSSFVEFTSDEFSHIVSLRPEGGRVNYYFGAAWVLEVDGLRDRASFERWVRKTAEELAKPVRVTAEK